MEGTSHGEHKDGPWRAGVPEWGAGRWCDVFEIRDFLIQRCFIYLDPGLRRTRHSTVSLAAAELRHATQAGHPQGRPDSRRATARHRRVPSLPLAASGVRGQPRRRSRPSATRRSPKTDRTLVPTCASRSMRSRDVTRLRADNWLKTPDDDVSVPSPKHLSRKKFCSCLTIRTTAEYISSNSDSRWGERPGPGRSPQSEHTPHLLGGWSCRVAPCLPRARTVTLR